MREEGVGCSLFPFFSLHPLSLQRPHVCQPSVLSFLPILVVFFPFYSFNVIAEVHSRGRQRQGIMLTYSYKNE